MTHSGLTPRTKLKSPISEITVFLNPQSNRKFIIEVALSSVRLKYSSHVFDDVIIGAEKKL